MLAAALVIGVVAVVVAIVLGAGRSAPLAEPRPANPVIVIPGYGGGQAGLRPLAAALTADGRSAQILDIGDGTADLDTYAGAALARAADLVAAGAAEVDLIGYSAGGLTARAAATDPAGGRLIGTVVTMGTPHNGTDLAALGAGLFECPAACRQMVPGSPWLQELPTADDETAWLSIYSTTDEVIRPPESSQLPGATNLAIQSLCERDVRHGQVPYDTVTTTAIGMFLSTASVPDSCPAG